MSKGNRGGPAMYGHDLFGDAVEVARGGALSERFLVPPFSLLDARDGWWRERKRGWLAFGIESEIGRADNLLGLGNAVRTFDHFREQSGEKKPKMAETLTGTSVFDPVLCELAYRWFSPADGQVLDPFAGGSVRGIIAAMLGREYRGVDLREEQIEANIAQAGLILGEHGTPDMPVPEWRAGDSAAVLQTWGGPADLVFTCPPYGDLETYSTDPRDISSFDWDGFARAYAYILKLATRVLRDDRFAVVVVGNYRDKRTGLYRDLVGLTIRAMEDAGLGLYNEAILVTMAGTLPIRASASMRTTRKLGKTHQNVLIFLKGDAKRAAQAMAPVNDTDGDIATVDGDSAEEPAE
ncbi:MAG: hypothetical protein ACSLE9_07840 [Burkholderiaceae bacterium]